VSEREREREITLRVNQHVSETQKESTVEKVKKGLRKIELGKNMAFSCALLPSPPTAI